MAKQFEENPSLFRELNQPHENIDTMRADAEAFLTGVSALRAKFNLANVYMIVETPVMNGDEESVISFTHQWGDAWKALPMTAYAYGKEQSEQEALIQKVMNEGKRRGK